MITCELLCQSSEKIRSLLKVWLIFLKMTVEESGMFPDSYMVRLDKGESLRVRWEEMGLEKARGVPQ